MRSLKAVEAATKTAEENSRAVPSSGEEQAFKSATHEEMKGALDEVLDCSGMAFEIAYARATFDKQKADELSVKLHQQFGTCDPQWRKCIEEYVVYYKLKQQSIPYRSGLNNILSVNLPSQATIGFIGDWGTGTPEAVATPSELRRKSQT